MRRYLKSQHINKFLRDHDDVFHNQLRTLCIDVAKGTLGEEVEESIGDCLVFVWFCSAIVEIYSATSQLENLRVSFISKSISDVSDEDGELYTPLLSGMEECEEWEDYCSLYGSLEELYDNLDEDTQPHLHNRGQTLAEKYINHVNLESELSELTMANFDFADNPNAPIMLFN